MTSAPRPSSTHLTVLLALLVMLISAVLLLQLERSHSTMHDKLMQQTEQRGRQLAEAIGGQIDALISSIDLSLLQLRREWLRDPAGFDTDAQRALSAFPPGAVTHLSIADRDGLIVYNSIGVTDETRVNDRPHFREHLVGPDRLVIGTPVQSRLLGGEWTFIVNRPILGDGGFMGTINMSISSAHIAERLAALRLTADDIISVVAADGSFIARSRGFDEAMGQRLPSDRPFLQPDAEPQGVFNLSGQVDGHERIFAWQRVEPYRLFVVVGLSREAVLEPMAPIFRRDHIMTAAMISLLAGLGAVILLLFARVARQQREVDRNAAFRKSIFDNSPVPLLVADARNLQFLDCNPAAATTLGLRTKEEAIGSTLLDYSTDFQPDGSVSAKVLARMLTTVDNAGAAQFEWRQQRSNGEQWDAEVHVLAFRADNRDLLQFTLRDISERKRAQNAVVTSEERLRQAMRIAQLGVFDHDHIPDEIYWSPELREMYGIAAEAPFTLGDMASLIHPDDAGKVIAAVRLAHDPASDGVFNVAYRICRHDGEIRWLTSQAQTYFRGEGAERHPHRTVGAVLDITEQRLAEEALRHTNTALSAVRHAQSQFMAKCSAADIFNDLLKAILSLTESEYGFIGELHHTDEGNVYLKAHGITNIAWDDDSRRFYDENAPSGVDFHSLDNLFGRVVTDRQLIISNDPANDSRSTGVPAGHPKLNAFMGLPFFESDELLGIIALANRSDGYDESLLPRLEPITTAIRNIIISLRSERQRQAAELALQQLNLELETRVEDRTADLRKAMQEAERANEAKSEFLSRMSHELRTPLNAILGFGQLLETDPNRLTDEQQGNVSEILNAGRHLLDMINEVLDLARIESGRLDVSLEPVGLDGLIDACLAQMRPLADEKRIALSRSGPSACVRADHIRLKQVLLNLLSNAVKYNFSDSTAKVIIEHRPHDRVRISVVDTGPGIPATHLKRLFKPFERLESAYEATEGTGIGLALSKRLTEAMHGTIGVESKQGFGSTFWVELPETFDESLTASSEANPRHVQPSPEHDIAPAPQARVLYIEDNPANMKLVRRILASRTRLQLIEAESAEAGLIAAQQQHPKLILLDINLPGMNGFHALEQLKGNPLTRDIPVVALTANAMKRDIDRAQTTGFAAYLTKPVDVAQLLSVVDKLLA